MARTKTATVKTEKFEIKNRWSGEVIFTAELTCSPDTLPSIKLGLAVKAAVKAGADLARADLADADLADANLAGANLACANLARANLAGANLAGANLADADLADADLARAYLAGANLAGADLADADLAGAYLAGANLAGANLACANLADADLACANLADADLAGANLAGADNLDEEYLRPFKADLFLTLDSLRAGPIEALHLLAKLKAGEVDGSTYGDSTKCACLVGTIAQPRGVIATSLDHNSDRPAERWFTMIRPGDKPGATDSDGKPTGGGYAAQKALEWVEDWCACHGVDPNAPLAIAEQEAA